MNRVWLSIGGLLLMLWSIVIAAVMGIGRTLPITGQLLYLVDVGANQTQMRVFDLTYGVSAWIVGQNDEPVYVGTPLLVSPDGSQIAYQILRNNTLEVRLVNVDGSNIRRVEQDGIYEPIAWLPDSTHLILYPRGSNYLDVLDVSQMSISAQIQMPSRVCSPFNITLSPDGQYVAFQSGDGLPTATRCDGVRILNLHHDESRYVDLQASSQMWISWSNDSRNLAAWDSTGIDFIFDVTNPHSQNIADLFPSYGSSNVLWSPDDRRIAFVGYFTWSTGSYMLGLQPQIGQAEVLIPEDLFSGSLVWMPSGDGIIFTAQQRNSREIYAIDADGTNMRRITYNDEHEYNLVWLP